MFQDLTEPCKRQLIASEARKHLETPWVHQGRLPGVGIDCIGLLVLVAQSVGLPCEDTSAYARQSNGYKLQEELDAKLDRVDEVFPGCVLLFRIGKLPAHVGFKTDYGFIHTYITVRKVVETTLSESWEKRLVQAYRFKEWEH